jgi:outer membrane lipoprotein-sorting protein
MHTWSASTVLLLAILHVPASSMGQSQDGDSASELLRLSEAIKKAKTEVRFEAEQTVYAFTGKRPVVKRFRVQYAYPYRKRECIEGPEQNRFVTLEDGKYQWSYYPARKLVVKEPLRDEDSPFPLRPTEDMSFLMENYRFQVLGPVPAEGTRCRIVSFIPRQGDRPRREWWLEERWNVPVRVNVSSSDGKPAYIKELRDIRWNTDLDPDALRLRVPRDTRFHEVREQENLSLEEARRLLKRPIVLPRSIPSGYRLHDIVLRVQGTRQCLQIIYTDGLSSFSLFQSWHGSEAASLQAPEARPEKAPGVPLTGQHGLMNVVTFPGADRRAIIVGDLQKERLMEMAESIRAAIIESLEQRLPESLAREAPSPPPSEDVSTGSP